MGKYELGDTRVPVIGPCNGLVVGYVRCSTNQQNVQHQLDAVQEYCATHHYVLLHTFRDEGESGTKDDRRGLEKMLSYIAQKKTDIVIVPAFDRLSRSVRHLLTVVEDITKHSSLVSIRENFDTSDPVFGSALLAIFGAMGSLERGFMVSRTKDGIKSSRARNGGRWGRPPVEFDTLRAVQMRAEGASLRKIAKVVNVSLGKIHDFFKKRECSELACSISQL